MNSRVIKKNSNMISNMSKKQDNKNIRDNKDKTMINKFIINNQEFMKNYRKKHSKTPNKIKRQNPMFLINKNSETKRHSNSKKNIKAEINNPISSYNTRPPSSSNISKNNNINKYNTKNRINKSNNISNQNQFCNKKNANKLSRSESFSILRSNNYLLDKINPNKEININQSISIPDQNNIRKNKVIKKIYKIESICQVGYSGPGIIKFNQDNFFVYNNLNDENNILFIGVCDGHGILGHDVSKYLISHLPSNLNKALKKTRKYIRDKKTLYKTMKEVFIKTNKDLRQND